MKCLPFVPTRLLVIALLSATCLILEVGNAAEADKAARFQQVAQPLLVKYCIRCHGADADEGDVQLHALDPGKLGSDDAELWTRVVEVLKFGKMPPEGEPQPPKPQSEKLTDWIQAELAAAGRESDIEHKLLQPGYANLLNHEKLFDGSQRGPAFSPARLWRLHPEAYERFLESFGRQLSFGGPLSKPFTVGEGKGLPSNYAALLEADSATFNQLLLNCKQIAELQTFGFKRMEMDRKTKEMVERHYRNAPEAFEAILASNETPTPEQRAAAVAAEFQLVLSRNPSADEATAYGELLRKSIDIGGNESGLRTMAMAVMLRPDAIYRMEVGLGPADEFGRRMLSPYELAHALAYALTDSPPEEVLLGPEVRGKLTSPSLLDLARDGKLSTREDVRSVAQQVWETSQIEKPQILRFFQEFFGYHAAPTVFKGDRAGKEFAMDKVVKDADALVMHIVDNDHQVLAELLTTDRYFVQWPGSLSEYERKIKYITDRIKNEKDRNYKYFVERSKKGLRPMPQANPTWRITVRFFNLDERTWDYPLEQPFPMPAGQRMGILTHPAWLVAWSENAGNDPIRRGKWIREHLLAGSVPDVPITVNAAVPEDPHKSLRDRLQVTREAYCWQCHRKMDPLGLPFEAYNDFGQFRTEEGLGLTKALAKPKETAPVVTTGEIIDSGDPALDGEVQDAHELMERLAHSQLARQSFVRHAFRYWMGRNEMLSDSPTLIAADQAYADNDGSFKALVLELLTSDSFLYRR